MQCFLVVCREYPTHDLIFLSIHTSLYKNQVTCGIFHGIPLENYTILYYTILYYTILYCTVLYRTVPYRNVT